MTFPNDGFGGYLILFVCGFLATEIWRWLGLAVGTRLNVADAMFQWIRAVATTLVAGMVARMLLFPAGALADISNPVRFGAFAGGFLVFFLARRSLAAGVAGGAGLLVAAQMVAS